jgi:hypothetical protein
LSLSKKDKHRLKIDVDADRESILQHETRIRLLSKDVDPEDDAGDAPAVDPSEDEAYSTAKSSKVPDEPAHAGPSRPEVFEARQKVGAEILLNGWIEDIQLYLGNPDVHPSWLNKAPDFDFSANAELALDVLETMQQNIDLLPSYDDFGLLDVAWRTYTNRLVDETKSDEGEASGVETERPPPQSPEPAEEIPGEITLDGVKAMRIHPDQFADTPRGMVEMVVVRNGVFYTLGGHAQPKKSHTQVWVDQDPPKWCGPLYTGQGPYLTPAVTAVPTPPQVSQPAAPSPPPIIPTATKPNPKGKGKATSPDPKRKGKATPKPEPEQAEASTPPGPSSGPPADEGLPKRLSEFALRKKFEKLPPRSFTSDGVAGTQTCLCSCDLYPCNHSRQDVVEAYKWAKIKVQRPASATATNSWLTKAISWPRPEGDNLNKENPSGVQGIRSHSERLKPEDLRALKTAMGIVDDPLPPTYPTLTPEEQAKERARRVVPKWATAAAAADLGNIEKIRLGQVTAASKIQGPPVNKTVPANPTESKGSADGKLSAGAKWKALKDKFPGVNLWSNPASPDEKRFKKAYDSLAKELGSATAASVLPRLKRRDSRSGSPTASRRNSSGSDLDGIIGIVKIVGELARAFRGS